MDQDLNNMIVARLIQKATDEHPNWALGKKALQKSLYFVNIKHNTFSFRWADYGPFSGEVQQIVRDLEAANKIQITDTLTKKSNVYLKSIKYKAPHDENIQQMDEYLNETMEFVANHTSRDLELWASVHYWAQRHTHEDNLATYVYNVLKMLKPDAGFTEDNINDAIITLKENKLL